MDTRSSTTSNLKSTTPPPPDQEPRRIDLTAIMGGDREIIICHRNDKYRLRLTSNDRLLLTK